MGCVRLPWAPQDHGVLGSRRPVLTPLPTHPLILLPEGPGAGTLGPEPLPSHADSLCAPGYSLPRAMLTVGATPEWF